MRTLYAAEELLFSTVRIETEGAPSGLGCGTAFIFAYPKSTATGEGRNWLFLVTNKHVVEGCTSFTFFLHGRDGDDPKIGDRRDVRMVPAGGPWWQGHPDPCVDIAVIDLGRAFNALSRSGPPPFIKVLSSDLLPTPQQLEESDAVEDILFIGYPSGLFDQVNLMPIVRSGSTASHPALDYGGQPKFLIDASVFPGSSGSPVFLWSPTGHVTERAGRPFRGGLVCLLGLVSSVFYQDRSGRIELVPAPTTLHPVPVTPQMINLGVVEKASGIRETIEHVLRMTGKR